MPKNLTEGQMIVALRARYAEGWAFLPQVRNATGVTRITRTADALAMGLWPSMGIELLGFELKSSRTDWLKELSQPEKSEEIGQFCHRWWMVFGGPGIYRPDEDVLPAGWGAMQAKEDGKLVVLKEAPRREAAAPTWAFVASILRSMAKTSTLGEDIEIERTKAKAEGRREAQAQAESRVEQYASDLRDLQGLVRTFESATGVSIRHSYFRDEEAQRIARQVIQALSTDPGKVVGAVQGLGRVARELRAVLDSIDQLTALTALGDQLQEIQKGLVPCPIPTNPSSEQSPETIGSGHSKPPELGEPT